MELPSLPFRVLFFCVTNSCRSQMAEALARHHFAGAIDVWSAGARLGQLDPIAVEVLHEIGIDMSHHFSKTLADLARRRFNLIVTLTPVAHMALPSLPYRPRILPLNIPNPRNVARDRHDHNSLVDGYRQVRDLLKQVVGAIDLSPAASGRRAHASRRRQPPKKRPSGEYTTPAMP